MIRLHIPRHFDNLLVMKTLRQILEVYFNTSEGEGVEDSFNFFDYNKSNSVDYVYRFLKFLSDEPESQEGKEQLENILIYYSNRLQNLRGTLKVFDILKEMEDLINIRIGSFKYNVNMLEIEIDSASVADLELFKIYLSGFFSSLLYYMDIKEIIHEIILQINLVSNPSMTGKAYFINEYII